MSESNVNVDEIFANWVRQRIIAHFIRKTYEKYRKYEEQKADNEFYVHEILNWYFGFGDFEYTNPPGRVIVGDAVDDYLKNALESKHPVISIRLRILDNEYVITGKPDAVIPFADRVYAVEIKNSKSLKQYHVIQTWIYAYLLRHSGYDNVKCCVVVLGDRLEVHVFEPNYEFVDKLLEAFIRARNDSAVR